MSPDAASVGRRFFEQILGKDEWQAAPEILDSDVVMHHPSNPEPIKGAANVQGFLSQFRAGFPDLSMTVEDAFGDGDRAAVRWRMHGTHTRELWGIPATGKQVTVTGISVVRVANGKIVEDWVSEDGLGLMQQLGVIPQPG